MSNTNKTPESKPITIDDVEREIIASDLQPQVRTWLLVLIAAARKTETLRAATSHHLVDKTEVRVAALEEQVARLAVTATGLESSIQNVGANLLSSNRNGVADLDAIEKRVAKLEEANEGAAQALTGLLTDVEILAEQIKTQMAPVALLEPAVTMIHGYVETMKWAKDARGALDRVLAFVAPLIPVDATPPFDGAQIATRAMLDKQLTMLSAALHEKIERTRASLMDVLAAKDRSQQEMIRSLEESIAEAKGPRALLARWLRRGQ